MFSSIPGGALVFLGAVFWSLNAPIVKFLTLDSLLITGLRSAIAAVALLPFLRPKKLNWNGWMLLYVCSYAALCLSVIVALGLTSAPIAIGMQYTAAVWLFLTNWARTRRFDRRRFFPVCVIMVGVVFFMSSGTDSASSAGNLLAMTEGIFFAAMTVSAKKAAGEDPLGLTAVANIFTGVLVLALFPASTMQIPGMTGRDWALMLLLGVVQVGCGYGFYNLGVQRVSAQRASILALWEMILGPLWVALFLKEYPSLRVLTGFVIILAGMCLDARAPAASAPEAERPLAR